MSPPTTHVIIALYVDDLLISSKSKAAGMNVKLLLSREIKMKDLRLAVYESDGKKKEIADRSKYIKNFFP